MIVANPEGMIHALKADRPRSDNDMKVFKESKLYKLIELWLKMISECENTNFPY